VVEADQPGDGAFNSAIPATVSLNVARADQSISFAPVPNKTAGDPTFTVNAMANSGLPVYFSMISGPAKMDTNNLVTLVGAGMVTVLAWQPGDSNHNAAATVQRTFTVSKIPQTIYFGFLSPQKLGDAPFQLYAATSSGLPVNFSAAGPAALTGSILTLTGWGVVTVTASQPGTDIYSTAATVTQSFSVAPPNDIIADPRKLPDGTFQMDFYGSLGSSYTLQASVDLLSWISISNFSCTTSPSIIADPKAKNFSKRFYRIAQGSFPVPAMLRLNPTTSFSKTGIVLMVQGQAGSSYLIQASTNLHDWQTISSFTPISSPDSFPDTTATNYGRRFYRAIAR
jgi:hypothetical protein